jgi:hypothetical protein
VGLKNKQFDLILIIFFWEISIMIEQPVFNLYFSLSIENLISLEVGFEKNNSLLSKLLKYFWSLY